jgi:hypothetical protein
VHKVQAAVDRSGALDSKRIPASAAVAPVLARASQEACDRHARRARTRSAFALSDLERPDPVAMKFEPG